jgi:succinyl-diaminopimelate desuccinylase
MDKYPGMVENLVKLLQIESVMGEPEPGMPFGRETYMALKFMLELGQSFGFVAKDVDGYAGHIEWGIGEQVFGVLVHLDVVPAGENWSYPPFGTVIDGGRIYARGAMDDKSPAIAALYAAKRLKEEGFSPGRKFRLIMGLNEENGWRCMEYYSRHERMPDLGFSPDANFPVINREKGVLFVKCFFEVSDKNLTECGGGTRVNMVPDRAHFVYGGIRRDFKGISAHGSQPHKGENAIHKMMAHLKDLTANGAIHVIYELLCSEGFLGKLGMDLSDEVSGQLTINLGRLDFEGGKLIASLDIRYPVTFKKEEILGMLEKALPASIEVINFHRPLYVPEDDELIKKLLAAYKKVTGKEGYCVGIGGATYARTMERCVAFGPIFPDEESRIHTADEYIDIRNLYLMTDIYYEALKSLL